MCHHLSFVLAIVVQFSSGADVFGASSQDKKERCTLVVAPLALLEQWKDEIESKCRTNHFKCLIVSCSPHYRKTEADDDVSQYHGPAKPKSLKELNKYDVVLTTYTTLAMECVFRFSVLLQD